MLVDLQTVSNDTQSHYSESAFRMWEPDNKATDCTFKAPNHKLSSANKRADIAKWIQQVKGSLNIGYQVPSNDVTEQLQNKSFNSKFPCPVKSIPMKWQVEVNKGKEVKKALDDDYICQKFHEMVLGTNYPRCNSCDAKKLAQTSNDDTCIGIHTCLRLSRTSDYICKSESTLSILNNSESSTTITDNPSGLYSTKILSSSARMERWKRQMEDIRFPFLKLGLASSNEPKWEIVSEVAEDSSLNLSLSSLNTPHNEKKFPSVLKESEKDLDDKITKLHQLVSPFGKNEAPAVLSETLLYITFLHEQVEVLTTPRIDQGTPFEPQQQDPKQDLRSRGLCLIPVSSTTK